MTDLIQTATADMGRALEALRRNLSRLRTDRAVPTLLDGIMVSAYGSQTPISQVASITVADARSLTIQPWDKELLGPISRAIQESRLDLTPNTIDGIIRLNLPALTEETRRALVKVVSEEGESAKLAVRRVRQDTNRQAQLDFRAGAFSEDSHRALLTKIQNLTDRKISEVDVLVAERAAQLLDAS